MWVVYGISNCDSVKKARATLESRQIAYRFHDFRVNGLDVLLLQKFIDQLGLEALVNRRSTTWRQLSEDQKQALDSNYALQVLLEFPTLLKRPIIDTGGELFIGLLPESHSEPV